MVEIDVVTSEDDVKTCLNIRRIVFIDEQGVPVDEEVDGDDSHCTHILARIEDKPVGAARFQYVGEKVKIQRVCVLKEARGTGLGAAIILKILEVVTRDGKVSKAVLGAQTHALAFYEKLGFEAFGDEYMDAGIAHRDMEIAL